MSGEGSGTVRCGTIGFDGGEDVGAEVDLGEVVNVGVGEQEELVGKHQVLLLLPILAAGASAATAAVHLVAARLGWGHFRPAGSLGSHGVGSSHRPWVGSS